MKTIIVAGAVRSGTSLVMRILESCGIPVIIDDHKPPNESNPYGYYETRAVMNLRHGDQSVVEGSEGKAIKILPPNYIKHLPSEKIYKTIFMQRNPHEVASSFCRYRNLGLIARGAEPMEPEVEERFKNRFLMDHIERMDNARLFLAQNPNFETLFVSHNALMNDPLVETQRICDFLSVDFPQYNYNPQSMAGLVDINLYRNRHQ